MPPKYPSTKVLVGKGKGQQQFYMDGGLRTFLEKGRAKVEKRNKDFWMIVGGHEGDGKTTLAFQMATYLDPSFNLERCAFSGDQFIKMVRKAKPGQAVVYDEAVTGMAAEDSLKEINRKILKAAILCRKRRLYIFLCIPSIFLLKWYLAYERADYYLKVYEAKGNPGRFRFYNRRRRRDCYMQGRRSKKHTYTPIFGRFTAYWSKQIDEKEYDKLKDEGWDQALDDGKKRGVSFNKMRLGAVLRWAMGRLVLSGRATSRALLTEEGLKIDHTQVNDLIKIPLEGGRAAVGGGGGEN